MCVCVHLCVNTSVYSKHVGNWVVLFWRDHNIPGVAFCPGEKCSVWPYCASAAISPVWWEWTHRNDTSLADKAHLELWLSYALELVSSWLSWLFIILVCDCLCIWFSLADRSFSDIMQYPVMPWVIADYTSTELGGCNLMHASSYLMTSHRSRWTS